MDVMIPVWLSREGARVVAAGVESVQGAEVALVDDGYDASFTDEIERLLRERFGAIVRRIVKPNGSHPSSATLIEEAARCRVAIVGVGM